MLRTLLVLALLLPLSACATTTPADYAASLPKQERKWKSPACRKARAEAATYEARERKLYWSAGALIGPYGLGIVAAGKEHQARQRRAFMRAMHEKCSSGPLPKNLAAPAKP